MTLGVIDLQQMTPKGENALEGLHYTQIASAALRARDITNELSAIVEKDSLTNRCSLLMAPFRSLANADTLTRTPPASAVHRRKLASVSFPTTLQIFRA